MAVAFQSVSAVATATATNTVTVTKPADLAEGDLMIAHLARYDNDGTTRAWNIASGWTSIRNLTDTHNDGSTSASHCAQYKIADAADVAASNFSFTTASSTDALSGAIYRIDGQSISSVISASNGGGVGDDATPTYTTTGTITPSVANCLLLFLAMSVNDGAGSSISSQAITTSNPTWTEDYDDNHTIILSGAHATRPETTATGDATFSVDSGEGSTDTSLIIIAIAPAFGVTVSPDAMTSTSTVNAPAISGGAVITPSAITSTSTVNAPTSGQADFSAQAKSSTTSFTNVSKS